MKMKKNRWLLTKGLFFIGICVSMFQVGCTEDYTYLPVDSNLPTASLDAVASVYNVKYTNSSEHATWYEWNFGDGRTFTDTDGIIEDTLITYTEEGVYEVLLSAYDNNNVVSTDTLYVSVPYLSFNYLVNWGTIAFLNNEKAATSWAWDFGDGSSSTDENPVHEYLLEGKYMVTCMASTTTSSNAYIEEVLTDSAIILNPLFDGDRGLWSMDGSSTYSGSGSPTPVIGSGAKVGSSSQYLYQEVKVFPNQLYRISFYAAIDDKGVEGKSSPFVIYAGAGVTGAELVGGNLAELVSENTYTARSFDFTSDDSGVITIYGTYGDVTIRYCGMDIMPL